MKYRQTTSISLLRWGLGMLISLASSIAVAAPVASPDATVTRNEDSGAIIFSLTSVLSDDAARTIVSYAHVGSVGDHVAAVSVDNASGDTVITLIQDANGTETYAFRATNDLGESADWNLTLVVTPVNDAPFVANPIADVQTIEDGPDIVIDLSLVFDDVDILTNDDELTYQVLTAGDAVFASAAIVGSTLTLALAPDQNGVSLVTVRATDIGGLSAEDTFQVTVTPVNDAPSFNGGGNVEVLEDAGPQSFVGWASGMSAGPPDESGQTLTFVITNNSNPALFATAPAVDASTGTLSFAAPNDAFGTAEITLELRDNGGTANGGVAASAPYTFTIAVLPVNVAPSFTAGPDQTVLEDAGPQTVTGWATNLSTGPANESDQTLTFEVSNDNGALFSAAPAVSSDGTLTFTSAPDANGSALVTVVARDSGGTDNGGIDASAPQTFTITVTPVNDAPSFSGGGNVEVLEDAGPQSFAGWASGMSAGPPDEAGQTLTFEITNNSNPALFATAPAVDA
ncbi:MAG: hypothetical protein ACNA7W_17205, partial [Pseudomonadales bacterium]